MDARIEFCKLKLHYFLRVQKLGDLTKFPPDQVDLWRLDRTDNLFKTCRIVLQDTMAEIIKEHNELKEDDGTFGHNQRIQQDAYS